MKARTKRKSQVVAAAEAVGKRDKIFDLFEAALTKIDKKSLRGKSHASMVCAHILEHITEGKQTAMLFIKYWARAKHIEALGVFSEEEKAALDEVIWPATLPSESEVAA